MSFCLKNNIFLTGFMGAGKSTTGRSLAKLLHCAFVDLDALIVAKEKLSIADIFALKGEAYFRDCETAVLNSLGNETAAIYATGGGLVQREINRHQMRKIGQIIYLKTSWRVLLTRLQKSTDRPLVNQARDRDELKRLFERRQDYYADADFVVLTDNLTPAQVARNIVALLESDS